ncbi:MAG: hypothetical protein Q8L27_01350, partial [archaeon]|nr:hypothetical protein [archaeon]
MKKRSGVLVLGLFLILFSLSFVSADYWTGADYQGYCNPSTKYVSLGHATSYSGKTFSSAAAEKELCTLLPDNVLLNAGSTSTTRLGSVGDTAYCPEGSIVYGFKCLSPGPDCQYNDHLSDIYCVALSGNYDYAYSTSASSKISINCPVGKFVSGYYAVSSDTLQLRCVSITPACVKKTCADYPGQCGTLSDGCGSTRSCVC